MGERGKLVLLVLGALLTVAGLGVLISGGVLSAASAQRDRDGYVVGTEVRYTTATYALASEAVDLGEVSPGDRLTRLSAAGSMRLRARTERPDHALFLGIGAAQDVDAYLASFPHEVVHRVYHPSSGVEYLREGGTNAPRSPARLTSWAASVSGKGTQTLAWDLRPGRWTLVVMNADAAPMVDVVLQPGLKAGWLIVLARSLAIAGVLALALGLALVVLGGTVPFEALSSEFEATYPAKLNARLDEPLSRWLWLVKWFLAIPHAVILFFLWVAFAVLSVAAFFAILVTGRYPASLFATNVGVLRWSWRVGFYAYSALATDRYPPFSLRDADYPAHVSVARPQQFSRGLALVKWWLLAIPHYLIIAVFSGTAPSSGSSGENNDDAVQMRGGLLPLLVLFAGVALLFTGRYPRGIFDFIVGLHRWIFRVITYIALMHDEYPPFRVDLGGDEPLAPER
jgi:hypothetical protein